MEGMAPRKGLYSILYSISFCILWSILYSILYRILFCCLLMFPTPLERSATRAPERRPGRTQRRTERRIGAAKAPWHTPPAEAFRNDYKLHESNQQPKSKTNDPNCQWIHVLWLIKTRFRGPLSSHPDRGTSCVVVYRYIGI